MILIYVNPVCIAETPSHQFVHRRHVPSSSFHPVSHPPPFSSPNPIFTSTCQPTRIMQGTNPQRPKSRLEITCQTCPKFAITARTCIHHNLRAQYFPTLWRSCQRARHFNVLLTISRPTKLPTKNSEPSVLPYPIKDRPLVTPPQPSKTFWNPSSLLRPRSQAKLSTLQVRIRFPSKPAQAP
jgi:hypothetical protein